MPGQKHAKVHRQNAHRADANNNVHVQQHENNNNGPRPAGQLNVRMQKCCRPKGCEFREELIDNENPEDAVRVVCNNEACDQGTWMHKSCFDEWELAVLAYLKSCGRARSWSEKQRLQNLWTKKGYDLAYKACDCNCNRGHLRKDLDYVAPVRLDNAPKKKHKKKCPSKPELNNGNPNGRERRFSGNGNTALNTTQQSNSNANTRLINAKDNDNNHILKATPSIAIMTSKPKEQRIRTDSISSTGSSPPNSVSSCNSGAGSPVPVNQQATQNGAIIRVTARPKFEFPDDNSGSSAASGTSIFRRRQDLSAFSVLPKHKQNPYHIKMEDETVTGNDDVRNFVQNHLSTYKITSLNCVLCKNDLCIFDRYPLIDGTLFLSPQAYDSQALRVISEGHLQYINAVCVTCLEGKSDVQCAACKRKWDGSALLLGSMYSYDIFAAMPCCQKRLTCKHCRRAVIDINTGLSYFSEYSHMIPCPYCKAYDYHFIRPLNETFHIKMSLWH